jgi:hypothetical protein
VILGRRYTSMKVLLAQRLRSCSLIALLVFALQQPLNQIRDLCAMLEALFTGLWSFALKMGEWSLQEILPVSFTASASHHELFSISKTARSMMRRRSFRNTAPSSSSVIATPRKGLSFFTRWTSCRWRSGAHHWQSAAKYSDLDYWRSGYNLRQRTRPNLPGGSPHDDPIGQPRLAEHANV